MSRRHSRRHGDGGDRPAEIPMTDLGWSEEGDERDPNAEERKGFRHAAGTPGGGTASGGLAGTNAGDGDPDNADLEDALGSGVLDTDGEEVGGPPYSGHAGGAVGGTPAGKRARGGDEGDLFDPGSDHRGDGTVGDDPDEPNG